MPRPSTSPGTRPPPIRSTWTLYLLAEQPELQEQAAAEAQAALGRRHRCRRCPTGCRCCALILEESLRLYPPVPRFDREAVAADRLGEHEVEPGDLVSIWPWLSTATSSLWDDPDAFDTERFAGPKNGRHRFQYLPFGGGPADLRRRAVRDGRGADHPRRWLSRWRFVDAGHPARGAGLGMVTLRPKGGLPLAGRLDTLILPIARIRYCE